MSQYQDAEVILHFYELRREPRMRDARAFMTGAFKAKDLAQLAEICPPGSDENAHFRQVTSYWDMISAIVKRHLVDKELYFETNGEMTVIWEKVRHLVPALREAYKNPHFLANFELVANEREAYVEAKTPGYLAALRERLGVPKTD
ncbi:MAG: DUF4760 domain-containing protein [Vicinamibacteria bacterium]